MFDRQNWQVSVERLGDEFQPLVKIDGFAAETAALIEASKTRAFLSTAPFYPGPQANVPTEIAELLIESLAPFFSDIFGITGRARLEGCFFSLVTTRPNRLQAIQCLPHFDGVEENRLAVVQYLCDPHHGGTSFYRHRSTGFETINKERVIPYRQALARDAKAAGIARGYMQGDTPIFERTGGSEAVFNRALLYRGGILHGPHISEACTFDADPNVGRLTLTAFIICE